MTQYEKIDEQLSAWIDAHSEEIIEVTRGLLRIPSVKGEPADGAPFGAETRRALDFALGYAQTQGLTIRNLDGYAGHAEWRAPGVAEDAPIVGVLAHVDVVPAGDGWKHEPYGAELEDGIIYARGVADDKGPAMAGLFAVLAAHAVGAPATHRVRVILGADEESGFGCVKHYFAQEEMPATGFTPDAAFPLVYAEKGIANFIVTKELSRPESGWILESLSGGLRSNMVPDSATAVVTGPAADLESAAATLNAIDDVTADLQGDTLSVKAVGISAHGSTPDEGRNAVAVLAKALLTLDGWNAPTRNLVEIVERWGADTTGAALGVAGEDEVAGPLTSNLGVTMFQDGKLTLTFNFRYPVTWGLDAVKAKIAPALAESEFTLADVHNQDAIYIPTDDPLVATLLKVYRDETGDMSAPLTMGGGTYARAMKKGVAFGPGFPGFATGIHQSDERWPVDHLIRSAKIYAKAIVRLANG
ncbi:dipeptidase PepV [Capsulimonas corticalis]|uniref:Dipeptidase PepV n=1 Tax=Capsulimonas corticalis TaxID=2219043 RepID=A0A402CZT8_9BACT|nr:dipeptidase PepV [Capsulimonas corticalis]BDI33842.1 dipeptidase PepV [Capsulimonas corticalis]